MMRLRQPSHLDDLGYVRCPRCRAWMRWGDLCGPCLSTERDVHLADPVVRAAYRRHVERKSKRRRRR